VCVTPEAAPSAAGDFGTSMMSELWQLLHRLDAPSASREYRVGGISGNRTVLSIPEVARQHADAHRWFESERRGCDVGPAAYGQWRKRYWRLFCRWRYLEHLLGICCYQEFEPELFGSLRQQEEWSFDEVMDFALRRVLTDDREQVEVLYEAPDDLPRNRLLQVLGLLNVDRARLNPPDWAASP
jgi:hypothetical protein